MVATAQLSILAVVMVAMSLLPASALVFSLEFGCSESDGSSYSYYTNYNGIIAATKYSKVREGRDVESTVFVSCGNPAVLTVRPQSGATELFEAMFRSDKTFSFSDVARRLKKEGYRVRLARPNTAHCLCDPVVFRGARIPGWLETSKSGGIERI